MTFLKKQYKNRKNSISLVLLTVLVLAMLPFGSLKSANTGNLTINAYPAELSGVVFDLYDSAGSLVSPSNTMTKVGDLWTWTQSNVTSGVYSAIFKPIAGYVTPEADGTAPFDSDDPDPKGRKFYVVAGQANTVNVYYYPPQYLKAVKNTTAETLFFTPSASRASPQWQLLRGKAEVSPSNVSPDNRIWQRNQAEVLVVGRTPPVVNVSKSDEKTFISANAGTTEYILTFEAAGTASTYYDAQISDVFSTSPADQISKINIVSTEFVPDSDGFSGNNCDVAILCPKTINNTTKSITATMPGRLEGNQYSIRIVLSIDPSIAENTSIINKATLTVDGYPFDAEDVNIVVRAAAQERAGSVYAEEDIDMGPGEISAQYIIGAGGNISSTTKSEYDWTLKQYQQRADSDSGVGMDECGPDSFCGIMKKNVTNMKKSASPIDNSSAVSTLQNLNPDNKPEGGVWYSNGDLTVGSIADIKGRGTIIVENGNLTINDNIRYSDGRSMVGFIVMNGNVIIGPNTTDVDGIFYVYSETIGKGTFITGTKSPSYDSQLRVRGTVIASSFSLRRNYIGDLNEDLSDPANRRPAEVFIYDSRIIINPPPGFAGKIVSQLK